MRWCAPLFVAVLTALVATTYAVEDVPDTAVQTARAQLAAARANLQRVKDRVHDLRKAHNAADGAAKAAVADYQNKITLQTSAANIAQSAKNVVTQRQMNVDSHTSKVASAQAIVDQFNKQLPDKQAAQSKISMSLAAVDSTFPAPTQADTKADLQTSQKALDAWNSQMTQAKANLASAQSQLTIAQNALDRAKADHGAKSATATDAAQAAALAKTKADAAQAAAAQAMTALQKGKQDLLAAHNAVVAAVNAVKTALQARVSALQTEVNMKQAKVDRDARHLKDLHEARNASKAKIHSLRKELKAVEVELLETEKRLVKAEAEMTTAKNEVASSSAHVKHLITKLHDAQRETGQFKDPTVNA